MAGNTWLRDKAVEYAEKISRPDLVNIKEGAHVLSQALAKDSAGAAPLCSTQMLPMADSYKLRQPNIWGYIQSLRSGTYEKKAMAATVLEGLTSKKSAVFRAAIAHIVLPLLVPLLQKGTPEGRAVAERALCNLGKDGDGAIIVDAVVTSMPLLVPAAALRHAGSQGSRRTDSDPLDARQCDNSRGSGKGGRQ